ncbi:UNKNOWN [Stylonychia lemnae]|uniref:Glycosyltransferase 2-like domain-containing protein n=1 Tax=Stylonychia lemnae TaxID=5949 RepID=A0A078AG59_STYLE|nr:UNKNOWN [Stylonychia lemnae]|eukprot:CDW81295.1 UNKNOWN [Stylonychia lemnae]
MVDLFKQIEDTDKILQPNKFEFIGNQTIKNKQLAKNKDFSLCLNEPVMTVITVNKVQKVYSTPIYKFQVSETEDKKSEQIDEEYYDSVHIGDFILVSHNHQQIESPRNLSDKDKPDIAVLMTVYNDDIEYLNEAIKKGLKYIARMDADDYSLPQRLEIQRNYLESNRGISILGTSVITFGDNIVPKIICHPAYDEQLRYTMLYYCALAHPSVMMRSEIFSDDNGQTYQSISMEDYKLWLDLMQQSTFKFANLGIVLVKLRKHGNNKSLKHTIDNEADFKLNYLSTFIKNVELLSKLRANPNIVKEFITITGREIKSQEIFKGLNYKKELVQIFEELSDHVKNNLQDKPLKN